MVYQDPRYRDPEYSNKWRAAHPEKTREYSRRYLEDPQHREANRLRARRHYHANREARLARQSEYNRLNREAIRERLLARKYGLTFDAYRALVYAQGGACAICRRVLSPLAVDHDHATGAVRGLLCPNCNFLIGHGKDDPTLLRAAAEYLERTHA